MPASRYPLRLRLRRGIDTHAATAAGGTTRTACEQAATDHHPLNAGVLVTCPNCRTVLNLDR